MRNVTFIPSNLRTVTLGITFWVGEFALAGLAFNFSPIAIPSKLHLPFATLFGLGWVLLGVAAVYFAATMFSPRPFRLGCKVFSLPSPKMTLTQISVAASDFLIASATLYSLFPSEIDRSIA